MPGGFDTRKRELRTLKPSWHYIKQDHREYRPGDYSGEHLVKRLTQTHFEVARFDAGRFNVHQHLTKGEPHPTLVVLVHGLLGRGYKTWGSLPRRLFDGIEGPALDVGIYDYRNAFRGIGRRAGKWEFWCGQLTNHLRQIETEYSDIVLIGHSMGGLLIEATAKIYLERRALEHLEGTGNLIALFVISAPRAGSGWAVPPLQLIMPESSVLRRLAPRTAGVDEFFSTYIERHNVTTAPTGQMVLPIYAVYGAGDKLVSQFSAAFGVPTGQRLPLEAGHRSIVKPKVDDAQLVSWLHQKIADRTEVRAQAARLGQHATHHSATAAADPRYAVVTRFMSDSSGLHWEELYNEARRMATTTAVMVQDIREVPGADVHLLVAIHDASLVVAADQDVKTTVLGARAEQDRQLSMSVGICPVGADYREAEVTVRSWIADRSPTSSFYVKGAADTAALQGILDRLLQLIIGRDPHRAARAALADQRFEGPSDTYGNSKGGGF